MILSPFKCTELFQKSNTSPIASLGEPFVLRIKNNWKLEFQESTGLTKVGSSDDAQAYRVVNFCDKTTKTEFRLVTNLPGVGEASVSDDEIRDIYRLRWGVELLWKFLKMHLKLDKLITKNVNGITI